MGCLAVHDLNPTDGSGDIASEAGTEPIPMSEPRTLLTGATGTLGDELRPRLRKTGHDVRSANRSPPADADGEWVELDLADGTGIERALEGIDVVVHAATAPRGDSEAVDARGTERLLEAAAEAGVENVCYPSIVGIDSIPLSYYEHKLAAERALEKSDVSATVVRITQFHEFVLELCGTIERLPVWPVPSGFRVQPIAAGEAADAVVEHATVEPAGRVEPVGGPEVRTAADLVRSYREVAGLRRPVVGLPVPGSVASGFRSGAATRPDRAVGSTTWGEWLRKEVE